MSGNTLLSKRSRNWWKRMSGWMSPAEWCLQNSHLVVLTSACTQGRNRNFWQVGDMGVCVIFLMYFHFYFQMRRCLMTSPSPNRGRLRQPKLDVSWSSLPFLTTKGDFPSVLSSWLKRGFFGIFFSLSIVLIKKEFTTLGHKINSLLIRPPASSD